jgi:hypothetical protein
MIFTHNKREAPQNPNVIAVNMECGAPRRRFHRQKIAPKITINTSSP